MVEAVIHSCHQEVSLSKKVSFAGNLCKWEAIVGGGGEKWEVEMWEAWCDARWTFRKVGN